jgi:hypothetical protein
MKPDLLTSLHAPGVCADHRSTMLSPAQRAISKRSDSNGLSVLSESARVSSLVLLAGAGVAGTFCFGAVAAFFRCAYDDNAVPTTKAIMKNIRVLIDQ